MEKEYCLFCDKNNSKKHKIICENDSFYARWDNYPVSLGHSEVVPKKHINSYFDLSGDELNQAHDLLLKVKKIVDCKYHPNAYNVGINNGKEAGQSIFHLHIHLIPRYIGDVKNPRGGVRNVIPGKGDY